MTLADHYLRAVRMYLPGGRQTEDIISELSEHLRSKIEEQESELGRPLTEAEQEGLLTEHGNPMLVAERYGARRRSVALGWQLIGPELFPLYARILALNWLLTIAVLLALPLFATQTVPLLARLFWPLLVQLLIVTTIFAFIDAFQRRARKANYNWRFPPAYLQPIPRWQSIAGLAALATAGIWWALVPYVPALLLGRNARILSLASTWDALYWPVLLLLLVGVAQRATTLTRPDWNWLQAITRLLTNGFGVLLLYPFVKGFPYIVVLDSTSNVAAADLIARRINGGIWWLTVASLSLYWLFNTGFHVWLCLQHARYAMRRRAAIIQ